MVSGVSAFGVQTEFRGSWVTAWSSGFLSPQEADETVRLAKEANMNAIFMQVRKVGDAYYKSNFEARAGNISGGPDYDPLQYMIEKAHAAGIEVHAWFNTFRIWGANSCPADPDHIVNKNPEWLTRTASGDLNASEGLFLDPGVSEVQDYTYNVIMDVVMNYDIDGIHLDYVRYPGEGFGYAPPAVERFNIENGRSGIPSKSDPVWKQWRRDQITALVRRIYKGINSVKPNVKVTAATVPWGDCASSFSSTAAYTKVYQDWCTWMQEGIIDANIPMNYKKEANAKNAREYRNWINGFKRWQYNRHVYNGLDFLQQPELVARQIEAARKRGLIGMVGFSFNQAEDRIKLVRTLRNGIYSQPAVVPDMPWKYNALRKLSRELYAKAIDSATRGRDLDKAIELLKEALEADPKYVDAHYRLGRCYFSKGMYEEATRKFEEVRALSPNHITARKHLDESRSELEKRASGRQVSEPLEGVE